MIERAPIPRDERLDDPPNIWRSYREVFGEGPPAFYWSGDDTGFEALMEAAIARGKPLSARAVCRAQGFTLSGPDTEH